MFFKKNLLITFIQKIIVKGFLWILFTISILAQAQPTLSLSVGLLQQSYQEIDKTGLIADGVLNQETGKLQSVAVNFDSPSVAINPQWQYQASLETLYAQGETSYQGYLQQGTRLIPYESQTGNKIQQATASLRFNHLISQQFIISPLLGVSYQRWQRDLDQYQEKFDHTAWLLGLQGHWQPIEDYPLTVNATGQYGKVLNGNIKVTQFDFNQTLGKKAIWQLQVGADYQVTPHISLQSSVKKQGWHYGHSDVQNNLQYPDSKTTQTLWQLGLGYWF